MKFVSFCILALGSACTGPPDGSDATAQVVLDPTTPGTTWETAEPSDVGLDGPAVEAFIDDVFRNSATQGVVVVRNGYIVGERYSDWADAEAPATSWSMAKSMYAEAVGVAIEQGLVASLDASVSDYIDEWLGTDKANITVRNVLEMRTALKNDFYGMFLVDDMSSYSVNLELTGGIDEVFDYNNSNTQLLGEVLNRVSGQSSGDYLQDQIFTPIGVEPISMWVDEVGSSVNFAGIDATTRDFARFGLLMTRSGAWGDAQVVPADYVEASLRPASSTFYGYQWWTYNQDYLDMMSDWSMGGETPPEAPSQAFSMAWGADGQYLFPWPEEDILIAINTRYTYNEDTPNPVMSIGHTPLTDTAGDALSYSLAQSLSLALEMLATAER